MKLIFVISFLSLLLVAAFSAEFNHKLVCYYNSKSHDAEGLAQYSLDDIELALRFCTHIVYGYVGINPKTLQVTSLNEQLDIYRRHFATFTVLKEQYPDKKFLLSLGGDHDLENPEKYINLLESEEQLQNKFIESARDIVRTFDFDGLDLAFQFPKNKPRKVHSDLGIAWKSFKKIFTGDFIVDEKAAEHRNCFTKLVKGLKQAFLPYDYMLTLTVLPNVNSSWFFDAPAIINHVDFVNLAAFDFLTPTRNPDEADYTSPLYGPHGQNRLSHYSVNYQVQHWLLQGIHRSKINVGIASYGRAWKLTQESGRAERPIVTATAGPAAAGTQTCTPGILNWAEICALLPNSSNVNVALPPLRCVTDPTKRYNSYAFRAADNKGENGIWVSYDDPDTAANKAEYVKAESLGGVALFELNSDDFRGQCTGDKYPMLRAIKYRLSSD